jgi:hypothetical protein
VTADRCPSCGARIDTTRAPMQPPIAPASEPSANQQAHSTPEIMPTPASPGSAPPLTPPVKRNRRRLWLILGLVGALVLAICGSGGGVLYWAITSQLAPNQASETVLYKSSLHDSNADWPYSLNHCDFLTAGYLVSGGICVASEGPFDDTDISVTVRENNGSQGGFYGLVFRQHDGLNAYIFDISTAGQWRFYKIAANAFFPDKPNEEIFLLPTSDKRIHSGGAANTLLVRVIGGRFTFYANNFKLGEWDDTGGYASGRVGFIATQGVQAVFTNVLVTKPR